MNELNWIKTQLVQTVAQLQALNKRVEELESAKSASSTSATTDDKIPPMVNHANNGDGVFDALAYSGVTGGADYAGEWYQHQSDAGTALVENGAGAPSADGLKNSARSANDGAINVGVSATTLTATASFVAGDAPNGYVVVMGAGAAGGPHVSKISAYTSPTQITMQTAAVTSVTGAQVYVYPDPTHWNKSAGLFELGGKRTLAHPLVKNIATPSALLYVRFQIKKNVFTSLPAGTALRVAVWDNTAAKLKLVESEPFDLTVTANHSSGAVTRKYILKVTTASTFFYSDVLTPSQVTNTVSVSTVSNSNYVDVDWQAFQEAIRYQLFRHDSEFNEWRQIADITNNATAFRDTGGRSGAIFTPPVGNVGLKAEAVIKNIGNLVGTNFTDLVVSIRVPSLYNYTATTDKQWLRIDLVASTYGDGLDNHYVDANPAALIIDRVGIGFTNGRWSYSAKDLVTTATIVSTAPPPVPIGGGDEGNPNEGGGGFGDLYQY